MNYKYWLVALIQTSIGETLVQHIFLLLCAFILEIHLFGLLSYLTQVSQPYKFGVDVICSIVFQNLFWNISWMLTMQHKQLLHNLLHPLFHRVQKNECFKSFVLTLATAYFIVLIHVLDIDKMFISSVLLNILCCHYIRQHVLKASVRNHLKRYWIFAQFFCCPNTRVIRNDSPNSIKQQPNRTGLVTPLENYMKRPPVPPPQSPVPNQPVPNLQKKVTKGVQKIGKQLFRAPSEKVKKKVKQIGKHLYRDAGRWARHAWKTLPKP